jgi:hypothetical protein
MSLEILYGYRLDPLAAFLTACLGYSPTFAIRHGGPWFIRSGVTWKVYHDTERLMAAEKVFSARIMKLESAKDTISRVTDAVISSPSSGSRLLDDVLGGGNYRVAGILSQALANARGEASSHDQGGQALPGSNLTSDSRHLAVDGPSCKGRESLVPCEDGEGRPGREERVPCKASTAPLASHSAPPFGRDSPHCVRLATSILLARANESNTLLSRIASNMIALGEGTTIKLGRDWVNHYQELARYFDMPDPNISSLTIRVFDSETELDLQLRVSSFLTDLLRRDDVLLNDHHSRLTRYLHAYAEASDDYTRSRIIGSLIGDGLGMIGRPLQVDSHLEMAADSIATIINKYVTPSGENYASLRRELIPFGVVLRQQSPLSVEVEEGGVRQLVCLKVDDLGSYSTSCLYKVNEVLVAKMAAGEVSEEQGQQAAGMITTELRRR